MNCGTQAVPKVERSIDPMDFSSIPRTRDFINSQPESERVCAEHGEAVVICLSDFVLSPSAGPPFGKARFRLAVNQIYSRFFDINGNFKRRSVLLA
jgi:hypothetical protein